MLLTRPEGPTDAELKPSRRALGSLFFAGYALAGMAANAQPITTPDDGLVIEEVTIDNPDGTKLPAYVARPQGTAKHGAIIVVSEIFGLHAWIKDVARRFAQAGYVAVAPAFFHRTNAELGDPATKSDFAEIRKIVSRAGNEQVMGDVGATIAWLNAHPSAKRDAVGITGFCWGGTVVWMAAERFADGLDAGVAWYGRVEAPADPAQREPNRQYPIEFAERLKTPVLGLYGALDKGIPVEGVERMRAALKSGGTASDIVIYPDADHGFLADYRATFHKPSAEDAWAKALDWFGRHVKG
jgi:carboxymethylenebutenolidase